VAHFPSGALDDGPSVDLAVLADAAAAAFGLPELRGRSAETARARRAAVHAAGPDVPSELLSDSLGVGVRAVQSLRLQPREPHAIRAGAQQARLRTRLLTHPVGVRWFHGESVIAMTQAGAISMDRPLRPTIHPRWHRNSCSMR